MRDPILHGQRHDHNAEQAECAPPFAGGEHGLQAKIDGGKRVHTERDGIQRLLNVSEPAQRRLGAGDALCFQKHNGARMHLRHLSHHVTRCAGQQHVKRPAGGAVVIALPDVQTK